MTRNAYDTTLKRFPRILEAGFQLHKKNLHECKKWMKIYQTGDNDYL